MQPTRPPVGCTFHILHRDKSAGKGVSHVLGVFQKDCLADTSSALHRSCFLRAADNEYCRSTAILIGTSGKVRFINNKVNTRVGSIRIKDDPSIWYESGRTTNFLIENNVFFHCGEWSADCLIQILTRCTQLSVPFAPIHRNIRILNNTFVGTNKELLCANHVDGLVFAKNKYYFDRKEASDRSDVVIDTGNCINCSVVDNEINLC